MTEDEIKRAEKDARADAESLGLLLLIAFRKKDSKAVQPITFDAAKGKFYLNGRAVSIRSIRMYLTRIEERLAMRLSKITGELESGQISLEEWKREFDRTIKSAHILAASLALGGIGVAITNPKVLSFIDEQLAFGDLFTKEIRGKKAGSIGAIRARARSYMRTAHITYSVVEQQAREVIGIQTEARRIRRASESCAGCVKYSGRWIAIEKMPPIGSLECKIYCRCYLIYQ